jgi:RNA polymerase sigma-70 factor (ECF subfamily)
LLPIFLRLVTEEQSKWFVIVEDGKTTLLAVASNLVKRRGVVVNQALGRALSGLYLSGSNESASGSSCSRDELVSAAFRRFREPLYRHALLLTRSREEAEEIVQEGFLKLHTHVVEGKRIDNVRAWLFRVAHNAAIDCGRTTREKESLSESPNTLAAVDRFAHRGPSPEMIFLQRERESLLAAAVERLPNLQRHCLYLRKEGLTYREIATVLAIGETTVIDHLTRAITRLHREVHVR